jgi:hypothetical protein
LKEANKSSNAFCSSSTLAGTVRVAGDNDDDDDDDDDDDTFDSSTTDSWTAKFCSTDVGSCRRRHGGVEDGIKGRTAIFGNINASVVSNKDDSVTIRITTRAATACTNEDGPSG